MDPELNRIYIEAVADEALRLGVPEEDIQARLAELRGAGLRAVAEHALKQAEKLAENHHFHSPLHAYIGGKVYGLAIKHGLDLVPVMDEQGYTSRYELRDPDFENVRVFISVEPPVSETDQKEKTQ